MANKIKNTLSWTVLLCLFLTLSVGAKSPPLELRVDDAIKLALQRNLDFRLVSLDLEQAQADLGRAEIVRDEEMLKTAVEGLEKAQKLYEEKKEDLTNLVRSSYQELLESETSLANSQKARQRATEQLEIDQSKFKAGLLSTLDIQRAENSMFSAENSYENALITLETRKMEFNQLLGIDLTQEVVLTEELLLDFLPFELGLEECYDLALELDKGVLEANEALQKADEAVELARSPFVPRVELEKASVAAEQAKIGVQKAEQALYFKMRSDYYELHTRIQNLEAKERAIQLEAQTLKAEESKYAAGVLSNAQIVAQQEKLAQLEQEYSAELLNYSLARFKFLQTIGMDDPWGERHAD